MRTRTGLALIVVIGILGVLAVLALAFVAMAQLERRASEQRLNAARAYLLARSGVEDALARLELGQDASYGGENWDASSDGLLSGYEGAQEVHHRTGVGTPADIDSCPVRHAMRPSFFVGLLAAEGSGPASLPEGVGNALGSPAVVVMEGRHRAYSGLLSEDYAPKGNSYALKVKGGNEGIFINGGDPAAAPTEGYNAVLKRMLGTLAEAVDRDLVTADVLAPNDGKPVDQQDGWALIDARPSKGWTDWKEVRDRALGGSQEKLDALRPYLTLHAWTDKKVIAPNCHEGMIDKSYHSWGEMKLDHVETKAGSRAPDFERMPVQGGRIVGRAPVSLDWARRHRPVLIALLADLRGLYLDETTATNLDRGDLIGTLREAKLSLDWTPVDDCHLAAAQIMGLGHTVATWQQWDAFCDGVILNLAKAKADAKADPQAQVEGPGGGSSPPDPELPPDPPPPSILLASDYFYFYTNQNAPFTKWLIRQQNAWNDWTVNASVDPGTSVSFSYRLDIERAQRQYNAERALLKAAFNPNGDLNKSNPNPSLWRSVDKQDLLGYSTELNLLPSGAGDREVSSVGRVLGSGGRLLASRVLGALVQGPFLLRLTTQKEFVCEDLGRLDVAGDERHFRIPGQASDPFINRSAGLSKTWGHTLEQPGLGDQGAGLQTYPEPVVDDGKGLSINPPDYDGNIQLATIETKSDEFYSVPAPTQDMKMLARYTKDFDLDVADAKDPPFSNPEARLNQPDTAQLCKADLGTSVLGARKLNTLYPDGCYVERERAPAYLDKGNADGFHGMVSFWVKANHQDPSAIRARGHKYLKWTNHDPAGTNLSDSRNQFFVLVDYGTASWSPVFAPAQNAIGSTPTAHLSLHFEVGHSSSDFEQEHNFYVPMGLTPHRWRLLSVFYDFQEIYSNDCGDLILDAGMPSEAVGTLDNYNYTLLNNLSPSILLESDIQDITQNDHYGAHQIGLGGEEQHDENMQFGGNIYSASADATFDEFAIYDFGSESAPDLNVDGVTIDTHGSYVEKHKNLIQGSSVDADRAKGGVLDKADQAVQRALWASSPSTLALNRYREGRYYKGSVYGGLLVGLGLATNSAAEYFSPPLDLGRVRIKGLAWTQIVPRGLRVAPPPTGAPGLPTGIPSAEPPQPGWDFDPAPPDGQISFELVDKPGTNYLQDIQGRAILGPLAPLDSRFTNDAYSPVDRVVDRPFRLHAIFQPNLADPDNTPILDPLALDDITLLYEPMGGPRITAWVNGEDG